MFQVSALKKLFMVGHHYLFFFLPLSSVYMYVCMHVCMCVCSVSTFSNIFLATTEAKFHVEPPWGGETKVYSTVLVT